MAINDWVEINYASNENLIGETAKVIAIKDGNIRISTDEGEVFWTVEENLSLC